MKTSIFDMNFVLPPLVVMTEVEKEMPTHSGATFMGLGCANSAGCNC
jgi:hypothetical protein